MANLTISPSIFLIFDLLRLENCPECGAKEIEETDLKEEMFRFAEKYGCRVEVVNHSDRLMRFQEIGALFVITRRNNI